MSSIVSASTGDQEGKGAPSDKKTGRKGRFGGLKNELVVRRHWLAAVSTRFQPDDEELSDEELYYKYRDKLY